VVLLGRLAAGAGALFMPLALAMPFYGLKNQPDDTTVYRDLSGWSAFGAADIVLVVLSVIVFVAVVVALAEDLALLAGVVAFGCGLAALALAISESVSSPDLSEDIEVIRYGAQFVVICAALQAFGGGLMLAGGFDEKIDSALGLR
jgi:hypothetical protein